MRLLLDECLPRKLKDSLPGHDCRTVPEAGLAGRKNGELLLLAEKPDSQALLTVDQGVEYQQNLRSRTIAVLLLRAKSSRLADLVPLMPEVMEALASMRPGQLTKIGRD